MTENQILICGHGSGRPSTKNMFEYLSSRQNSKATNGKTKGLVEVRRFLKTDGQRKTFHDTYKTILGRNYYSQDLRSYCYKKYKDGYYYSDCSSSGCLTYEKCGLTGVSSYNTAAMHYNGELVAVKISNGHIDEDSLSKLKVGDALLFRGNDPSRPLQIGHVEYIYELPGKRETYGYKEVVDAFEYVGPDFIQPVTAKLTVMTDGLTIREKPDFSLRDRWFRTTDGYISAYRVEGEVTDEFGTWYEQFDHKYLRSIVKNQNGKDFCYDRNGYRVVPVRLSQDGSIIY